MEKSKEFISLLKLTAATYQKTSAAITEKQLERLENILRTF